MSQKPPPVTSIKYACMSVRIMYVCSSGLVTHSYVYNPELKVSFNVSNV